MGKLGAFLERFYGPEPTFQTVQARIRRKRLVGSSTSGRLSRIGRPRRTETLLDESIEELEVWGVMPDKIRIVSAKQKEGKTGTTMEIVNGDISWRRFEDGTVEKQNERRSRSERIRLPTEFERHFSRGLLRECFAALSLEAVGDCHVADRDCLKVQARPTPSGQLWPHWFSFSANEFDLALDVEKAVVLSIIGMEEGNPTDTHEVLEVKFDSEIHKSLFTYEAASEEVIQPATPISEHITLKAAAARAPFTVFHPEYVPDRDRLTESAMYSPSRPDDREETLTVFYQGDGNFESLWVSQSQNSDKEEEFEWEEIEVEGLRMQFSDPHSDNGLNVLACRIDETHICIISDLPQSEMVRIASSMKPVRR